MAIVQLLHAEAGSTPTGTGSFSYFTNFQVVVANLAFDKEVGIWGHDTNSGTWQFYPCSFSRSVPDNQEVWSAHVSDIPIDVFDVRYQVLGGLFWDNNLGYDYRLSTSDAHTDGIGTAVLAPDVLVVEWAMRDGTLSADILVRNLGFRKQVAIVYTTDNWSTFFNAFGTFGQIFPPLTAPHQPAAELWHVSVSAGSAAHGQFAAFYIVNNRMSWDNNFRLNYSF